ncbi:MAG TPA: hypothetical protein VGR21_04935 [Cryptosporangiaceae bacterium]|nr:hypothetical protein [Cryptosporangiaceae bacterium]
MAAAPRYRIRALIAPPVHRQAATDRLLDEMRRLGSVTAIARLNGKANPRQATS